MKKSLSKVLLGALLACALFFGFLYFNHDIGISPDKIEADIRKSQKISEDWHVEGSISGTVAGYISYPEDRTDYSFSVYVNRPGLSFGYFFRGGGSIAAVEKCIAEFTVAGYDERVFISMNAPKAERIEIDDGNGIRAIEIDSHKPFAIVLPMNAGSICFYDVNGNVVEYFHQPL